MIIFYAKSIYTKNAGPKAPRDINVILGKNGPIYSYSSSFISKIKLVIRMLMTRFSSKYILIQHPIIYKQAFFNLLPKNRTIILIHDISGLRSMDSAQLDNEIKIFNKFKYIVAHNKVMKEFLVNKGI